jgi:hypothetical protein
MENISITTDKETVELVIQALRKEILHLSSYIETKEEANKLRVFVVQLKDNYNL